MQSFRAYLIHVLKVGINFVQESNQNDDDQPAKPVLHVQPIIMKAKTSTLGIQVVHDSNWFRACNVPRINDEINFEQEKPKKA